MPNNYFEFKQFKIQQELCAMKVSTDAVLLGAWADTKGCEKILDVGTGTGVIALMMAQRSEAQITAIDIDNDSAIQAGLNASDSRFQNRIQVKCISLQEFERSSDQKFDLIVSNPPYFVDSLKNNTLHKTIARHTRLLPYEDLITGVKALLQKKGRFCLILPKNEARLFSDLAQKEKLYLIGLVRVFTLDEEGSEKRHLMQFETEERTCTESKLVIESGEDHVYTQEYRQLTRDFYLHY